MSLRTNSHSTIHRLSEYPFGRWWMVLWLCCFVPFIPILRAQHAVRLPSEEYPWENFLEEYMRYVDALSEDGDGVTRYDWLEELEELHHQRLDLNAVSRDDLLRLRFLSEEVADSIIARREKLRGFYDIGDLMTVSGLNFMDRAWLSLFVAFGPYTAVRDSADAGLRPDVYRLPESSGNRWVGGKHTLAARTDIPLYRRSGFRDYNSENYQSKMFLGPNFSHRLKYRYDWQQQVKYGFTLDQDVGERMMAYGARMWDFGSAYFQYRADSRRRAGGRRSYVPYEVVVGDYRLGMGEGLVMGESGWSNSNSLLSGARTSRVRLRPHSGSDESRFLRGGAAMVRWGRNGEWSAMAFASWREMDGSVKGAKAENGYDPSTSDTITAWKTDGLHRTIQETRRRRVANQLLAGARVAYTATDFAIGINAAGLKYSRVYWPQAQLYNDFRMRGDKAAALSIDWMLRRGRWSVTGEVAADPVQNVCPQKTDKFLQTPYRKRCALAAVATVKWAPAYGWAVTLSGRSLARDFVTPYGRVLQAGTGTHNEQGVALALKAMPASSLQLNAFADWAYHPEPTYSARKSSQQFQGMAQATWLWDNGMQTSLSYKIKGQEANVTGIDAELRLMEWKTTQRLQLQHSIVRSRWQMVVGAEGAFYHTQTGKGQSHLPLSRGGLVYVRGGVSLWKCLRLTVFLAGFLTDDYSARCYVYSPQLEGNMGVSACAGKGVVAAFVSDCQVWHGLSLAARLGMLKYFDRDVISSGVNAIDGSVKNDVTVVARWQF